MLWSAPRSRSTAFFRMMIERGDFTGVHEPFSYLAEFGYAEAGGGPGPAPRTGEREHPAAAAYLAYHLPFYRRLHAQRLVIG